MISCNFQNSFFEIININMTEIVLIQVFFFTVGSKTNKNENTENHGALIPLKSQLYLKLASSIFLVSGWCNLVLYLHVWVKSKLFW